MLSRSSSESSPCFTLCANFQMVLLLSTKLVVSLVCRTPSSSSSIGTPFLSTGVDMLVIFSVSPSMGRLIRLKFMIEGKVSFRGAAALTSAEGSMVVGYLERERLRRILMEAVFGGSGCPYEREGIILNV